LLSSLLSLLFFQFEFYPMRLLQFRSSQSTTI